jgi:hypothetical protein
MMLMYGHAYNKWKWDRENPGEWLIAPTRAEIIRA